MSKIQIVENILSQWKADLENWNKEKNPHGFERVEGVVIGLESALRIFKEPSNDVNAPGLEEQRKADCELDEVHPPELRAFE